MSDKVEKTDHAHLENGQRETPKSTGLNRYIIFLTLWSTLGSWTYGYSISVIAVRFADLH
jgi:hypothetical protein